MKKYSITLIIRSLLFSLVLLFANSAKAQSSKDKELIQDCDSAKAEFIKTDALLSKVFASATGYVIFPNVGKGAVGVGGASGNGIVYERGVMIGKAKLSQVSIGFQLGGQAYRELIFFREPGVDRPVQKK